MWCGSGTVGKYSSGFEGSGALWSVVEVTCVVHCVVPFRLVGGCAGLSDRAR